MQPLIVDIILTKHKQFFETDRKKTVKVIARISLNTMIINDVIAYHGLLTNA